MKLQTPKSENGRTLRLAVILLAAVLLLAFFFTPGKYFQAWINPASATLSQGDFCVISEGYDEGITGKRGAVDCGAKLTPAAVTITSCQVTTTLGVMFKEVTLKWTSPQPPSQMRLTLGRDTAIDVPSDLITHTKDGDQYNYTATINQSKLVSIAGGLLQVNNTLRVTAGSGQPISYPPKANLAQASRNLSVGGVIGLAGNNTCT